MHGYDMFPAVRNRQPVPGEMVMTKKWACPLFVRRYARLVRIVVLVLMLLAGTGMILSRVCWLCDQLANLAWIVVGCGVLFLALSVLCRRWILAIGFGLGCLVPGLLLLTPRAATTDHSASIKLMIHNTHSTNRNIQAVVENIEASRADVVVLVEVNPKLVRMLRHDKIVADTYPYMVMRGPIRDVTPWRIVLSAWPLEDRASKAVVGSVVHSPLGDFGIVAVHPSSPRNRDRWLAGNELVKQTVDVVNEWQEQGLPVIVAGDMNSTPTGWRSRYLSKAAGLFRCKPRRVLKGTYPASMPGVLSLAIDDAWVSKDWAVSSWKTVGPHGSDHRAVEIGLVRLGNSTAQK